MSRAKTQSITLFIVCSIGVLGALGFLEPGRSQDIPMGIMMATISLAGYTLGGWLWRRP
jgi:hypothetical protein